MSDPYLNQTFGNVQVLEKIGQGGMGLVYRGRHLRFDKDVAIKLLPPDRADESASAQQRFIREGRMAASIHHRNVVQVLDAGTEHDVAYMILELVPGKNIGAILDERERMDPDEVLHLVEGIAEGLGAIHAQGVVHRDIKPDNLLLGPDGVVKITDLGLARVLDDADIQRLTATGMVVGTPLYVAPESVRNNRDTGPQSDIYGLGCSLYHMLAGRPPFDHDSPYEVMRAHIEEQPQDIAELCPSAPPVMVELVRACLAKEPDQRPTPAQIVERLRRRAQRSGGGVLEWITGAVVLLVIAWLAWRFLS